MDEVKRMKEMLGRIVGHEGVFGAFVVSRDGICVADVSIDGRDLRALSSDSPVFAGAIEAALADPDAHSLQTLHGEGEACMMTVAPVEDDFMLLALARGEAGEARTQLMTLAVQEVAQILGAPELPPKKKRHALKALADALPKLLLP